MKKVLTIMLAAAMITFLFSACSYENTSKPTTEPQTQASAQDKETSDDASQTETSSKTEAPEIIPAAVDLRNYNGKCYVTPVKAQGFFDCWSFGNVAAAESSYLYVNDLGIPAGQDNTNINFSERYMSWYVYHSITEDDVKLGRVRASQVGEGYDPSDAEDANPNAVFVLGGAGRSGSIMFSSGFGPVDETAEVNGAYPYFYSGDNQIHDEDYEDYVNGGDWSIPQNAEYRNPELKAFLRNGNLLPCPAVWDSDGNYSFNEEGVSAIKSEIAKGHAVSVTALVFGRMNYDNWAAYTPDNDANHVITIIGYDDDYPKENFTKTDDDGKVIENSTPPTNGAFIIKDSNGEVGGFDQKGTFYISYHDHTLRDPVSFEFDKSDSVKYTNLNYDQYDMLMIGWLASRDFENEAKMANVFDAEEDEYLYQLSYRTKDLETNVHYEIYQGVTDGDPSSGTLLEEGDNSHNFAGSHKIDLKNEHLLKKEEKYSVVLTMTHSDDSGKTAYTEVIPYAASLVRGAAAKGVVNKGESYLFTDGKWTDLTEISVDRGQQAYGENIEMNIADDFKAHSFEDIAVDNCPIKAILVPAGEYN